MLNTFPAFITTVRECKNAKIIIITKYGHTTKRGHKLTVLPSDHIAISNARPT